MMDTYEHYDYYASHAAQAAMSAERHVLAERYKTKMCRNYLQHGECPYEVRCMFAHGDHEMRTCEMNIRDGLTTEEAIKSFQRMWTARSRHMRNSHGSAAQHMQPCESSFLSVHDYVGVPARSNESYFTHNPYGYAIVRHVTVPDEEAYCSEEEVHEHYAPKVDPAAAMAP